MNKLGMWFLISTAVFVLIILALYGVFRLGQGNRDSSSGIKPDNDKVVAVEATMDVVKPIRRHVGSGGSVSTETEVATIEVNLSPK